MARKKTQELGQMAKKHKMVDDVTKEKSKEIIKHAKKKGYNISEEISEKGGMLGSRLKKKYKSKSTEAVSM